MNVRNCRSCGNLFNYLSGPPTCPACREKMEEKFQEVKHYIQENKGAGIQQVAEECEVEVSQIRQWLREERLELSGDSALYLNCDSCGKPIRSGRFCEKCAMEMSKGLQEVLKPNKARQEHKPAKDHGEGAKMRFLK